MENDHPLVLAEPAALSELLEGEAAASGIPVPVVQGSTLDLDAVSASKRYCVLVEPVLPMVLLLQAATPAA
jgi:hypothetical protein